MASDLLREHNVALALTDISRMPRPWEKMGDSLIAPSLSVSQRDVRTRW